MSPRRKRRKVTTRTSNLSLDKFPSESFKVVTNVDDRSDKSTLANTTKLQYARRICRLVEEENKESASPVPELNCNQLAFTPNGHPYCLICRKRVIDVSSLKMKSKDGRIYYQYGLIKRHFVSSVHKSNSKTNRRGETQCCSLVQESAADVFKSSKTVEETALIMMAMFLGKHPTISDHVFQDMSGLVRSLFGLLKFFVEEVRVAVRKTKSSAATRKVADLNLVFQVLSNIHWRRDWLSSMVVAMGKVKNEDDIASMLRSRAAHFMIDESTDISINSRLQLACSWHDDSGRFHNAMMDSFDCSKHKTGEHIYSTLLNYFQQKGLMSTMASGTADGASNVCAFTGEHKSALARFKQHDKLLSDWWCLMHQDNLAIGEGVKSLKKQVSVVRSLGSFFKGKSSKRLRVFEEVCGEMNGALDLINLWSGPSMTASRLKMYVSTRWGSFFSSAERIVKLSGQIRVALVSFGDECEEVEVGDGKQELKASALLKSFEEVEGTLAFMADFGDMFRGILKPGQTVSRPWIHTAYQKFHVHHSLLYELFRIGMSPAESRLQPLDNTEVLAMAEMVRGTENKARCAIVRFKSQSDRGYVNTELKISPRDGQSSCTMTSLSFLQALSEGEGELDLNIDELESIVRRGLKKYKQFCESQDKKVGVLLSYLDVFEHFADELNLKVDLENEEHRFCVFGPIDPNNGRSFRQWIKKSIGCRVILTMESITCAVYVESRSHSILFDSHSRDVRGRKIPGDPTSGKGYVVRTRNVDLLQWLANTCGKPLGRWCAFTAQCVLSKDDEKKVRPLKITNDRIAVDVRPVIEKLHAARRVRAVRNPALSRRLRREEINWAPFIRYKSWREAMLQYSGVEEDHLHNLVKETDNINIMFANSVYESRCKRFAKRGNYAWRMLEAFSLFNPSEYRRFAADLQNAVELTEQLLKLMKRSARLAANEKTNENQTDLLEENRAKILTACRQYFGRVIDGFGEPMSQMDSTVDVSEFYTKLKVLHGDKYREFADFALNALSFLGTTVTVEDTFSFDNITKSKQRSRLSAERLDGRRRLQSLPSVVKSVEENNSAVEAFAKYRESKHIRKLFKDRSLSRHYREKLHHCASESSSLTDMRRAEIKEITSLRRKATVLAGANLQRQTIRSYFDAKRDQLDPDVTENEPDAVCQGENDDIDDPNDGGAAADAARREEMEMREAADVPFNEGHNFEGWAIKFWDVDNLTWKKGTILKWVGPGQLVFEIEMRGRSSIRRRNRKRIVDLSVCRFEPLVE